jgi:RNA polymerase sigma-70 factor (ECF subfamily)
LHPGPSPPDRDLQLRLRAGDEEALSVLFARHRDDVFALCWRLAGASIADDLLQETFLRVWLYRASLTGRARFSTWLYVVARNVCMDYLSRRARDRSLNEDPPAPEKTGEPSWTPNAERRVVVQELLAELPLEVREALVLSRFHGLSYREIGEISGCSAGAVKVRIHRALERLRTAMKNVEATRGL